MTQLMPSHYILRLCRLVLWSGLDAGSVVLFDSGRGGQIPFEGVISEGPAVRIQFITDQPNHSTGFNIRFEGKKLQQAEPCSEPPRDSLGLRTVFRT